MPDALDLYRLFVPAETPEEKLARLRREAAARTPELTATPTDDQRLNEWLGAAESEKSAPEVMAANQAQFDKVRTAVANRDYEAVSGGQTPGLFTSSPLLGSEGSLRDVTSLYNKPLTSMVESTQLPKVTGAVGGAAGTVADAALGTETLGELGGQIGHGVPRMVAGGLVGGPLGMAADTFAQSFSETGDLDKSVKHALGTAVTVGTAGQVAGMGERFVANELLKGMTKGAPEVNRAIGNEMVFGLTPKIGQVAGAVVGAGAASEGIRQLETGGSNPFTAENVFTQAANAATIGAMHGVGALKSPRNIEAQNRLVDWFSKEVSKRQLEPGKTAPAAQEVIPLIEASLSGIDTHSAAKHGWIVSNMDKTRTMTDPVEQASAVGEIADQVLSTKNLGYVALTAGRLSSVKPPETLPEMTDVAKRYNELRDLALNMIDERAAGGEDVPSAAAVRQMASTGLLPKMDLAWFKTEFGDAAERTLNGDDMQAFRVLSQKVVNQTLILARAAKEARAEQVTKRSIEDMGMSSDALDDRNRTMGFIAAVNGIADKSLRDGLIKRYLDHEQTDQRYDKGDADKFMDEITDVVNKITAGRSPEQVATIDWANAVAPVEKRVVTIGETGQEARPIVMRDVKLGDYIKQDEEGSYSKKVYGRSNRNQRELLAQDNQDLSEVVGAEDKVPTPVTDEANWQYDLGMEAPGTQAVDPTIPEVSGAGKAPRGLYDPTLDKTEGTPSIDTEAMAGRLKVAIEDMTPQSAWRLLTPELVTARGTIDARRRESVQPYAKEIVAAMLELGAGRGKSNVEKQEVGPAAKALLTAKGMNPEMPYIDYRRWLDSIMAVRKNALDVRKSIVERLVSGTGQMSKAKYGSVNLDLDLNSLPMALPPKVPQWLTEHFATQPKLGASNTGIARQDLFRVMDEHFLKLGYEPAMRQRMNTMAQQVFLNYHNTQMQFAGLDNASAYVKLTGLQRADKAPTQWEQLATGGMYNDVTGNGRPMVSLALSHQQGKAAKELVGWHTLVSLGHELAHDLQVHAEDGTQGVYSDEQRAARLAMDRAAKAYTPETKKAILTAAVQAVIPREFLYKDGVMDQNIAGTIAYGSNTMGGEPVPSYEFTNVFSSIVSIGMMTNPERFTSTPEQMFSELPMEAALFAKGIFRTAHDVMAAVESATPDAGLKRQMRYLLQKTHEMTVSVEPMRSLRIAESIVASLDGKQWSGPAKLVHITGRAEQLLKQYGNAEFSQTKAALGAAKDLLFGPEEWHKTLSTEPPLGAEADKYLVDFDQPPPKGPTVEQLDFPFPEDKHRQAQVNIGAFWKWVGLMHQSMDHLSKRGLPLAQDVSRAFLGLLPAQQRMSMQMWSPFMTKNGKFDPENPLFQLRNDDSLAGRRDNATVNKVLEWQQRQEERALEQDANGVWKLTKKATDAGLGDHRGFLEQRVVGALLGLREVHYNMGQQLVSARMQSTAYRVAKLLMASQPKELLPLEYDRTLEAAGMIVRGLVLDQQAAVAQGLSIFTQPQREAVLQMMQGGLTDGLKSLNKMVAARDWWAPEQRAGTHLVEAWKDDKRYVEGAHSKREALSMQHDLIAKGYTDVSVIAKSEKVKQETFDSPEGVLQKFAALEQKAMEEYIQRNPSGLTPEQLATLEAYAPTPGAAVGEMLTKRGTNVYLKQRRGVPSVYGLDYVDMTREYVSRLAGTISRQMTQQQVELILSDDRLAGQDEFKTLVRQNLQAALIPNAEWQRAASSAVSSYFLGANLSSAAVNGFDTVVSVPETLLSQGHGTYGMRDALVHYATAIGDMVKYTIDSTPDVNIVRVATQKMRVGQKLTPEETKVWALQRAYDMKLLDKGQMAEVADDTDVKALSARAFGTNQKFPSMADMVKDPAYRVLQMSMLLPRMVHSTNNQISFFAGLQQAIDMGMAPQAALDHANKVRVMATFGGGKSNPVGAMGQMAGSPAALSVVRLSTTMQAYAFGLLSKYASHASNVIDRDPHLTPLARRQARQAFGYQMAVQLSLGGLMGMAGVAATMALLQKYFGVQAEAGVRKGVHSIASTMSDSPSTQGLLTEIAMNGAPNQLFGAAVGQRIGMQNILGMSSYDGFNLMDMVPGAAAGVVSSVVKGLGYAAQGEPQQAAHALVPGFLKNAVELAGNSAKYGDMTFRSPSGQSMVAPTMGEKALYAAGFQPSRLTQAKTASRLITAASKAQQQADAKKRDEAALALSQGNLSPARALQQEEWKARPPADLSEVTAPMKAVADRAAVMQSPADPLASVSFAASPEARAIAGTFPAGTLPTASKVEEEKRRIQLESKAGVPIETSATQERLRRAMMVDEIRRKTGKTAAEAEQMLRQMGL